MPGIKKDNISGSAASILIFCLCNAKCGVLVYTAYIKYLVDLGSENSLTCLSKWMNFC